MAPHDKVEREMSAHDAIELVVNPHDTVGHVLAAVGHILADKEVRVM